MDKLYNISKTAEILDVTPKTLRIWDKEGKLKPVLTSGGHRRYKESDINKILGTENKSLSQVINSIQLEEFSNILEKVENDIFYKYKMFTNSYARKNIRNVSIPFCETHISDNSLYEYLLDNKLKVLIYSKRNDFNTIDLYIVDFEK